MFSCKAAFTMRFFFHSIRTGIVLGTAPDSQDFVFKHTTSACRAFPHRSHFAWACLLEAPEAHGVARAAQCVRLVEAPATGCSFFRPRNVFFPDRALGFILF